MEGANVAVSFFYFAAQRKTKNSIVAAYGCFLIDATVPSIAPHCRRFWEAVLHDVFSAVTHEVERWLFGCGRGFLGVSHGPRPILIFRNMTPHNTKIRNLVTSCYSTAGCAKSFET